MGLFLGFLRPWGGLGFRGGPAFLVALLMGFLAVGGLGVLIYELGVVYFQLGLFLFLAGEYSREGFSSAPECVTTQFRATPQEKCY